MSVRLSYETACRAGSYVCTYDAILRICLTEEYQSVGNKQAGRQQKMLALACDLIGSKTGEISVPILRCHKVIDSKNGSIQSQIAHIYMAMEQVFKIAAMPKAISSIEEILQFFLPIVLYYSAFEILLPLFSNYTRYLLTV